MLINNFFFWPNEKKRKYNARETKKKTSIIPHKFSIKGEDGDIDILHMKK